MANRFRDIMDLIDGGGAGQMGSQFEGGGLLSVIANQIAKPYASVDEERRRALMQMRGLLDEEHTVGSAPIGTSGGGINAPSGTDGGDLPKPKYDSAAVQASMNAMQDNYMREAYGGSMPTVTPPAPAPANVPSAPMTMGNHPGMGPSGPELMPASSSMASGAPQSSRIGMPPVTPAGGPAMIAPSREAPPMTSETGGTMSMSEYEEFIAELMVKAYGAEAEGRIKDQMAKDPNFWQNSYNSYLQSKGMMPNGG